MPSKYTPELKARAIELVLHAQGDPTPPAAQSPASPTNSTSRVKPCGSGSAHTRNPACPPRRSQLTWTQKTAGYAKTRRIPTRQRDPEEGLLEDRVRTPQLAVFLLQLGQAGVPIGINARRGHALGLGLTNPRAQSLLVDPELLGDAGNCPVRTIRVRQRVQRHPRRAITQLVRVPPWCCHESIVLPAVRCLHQTRGAPVFGRRSDRDDGLPVFDEVD